MMVVNFTIANFTEELISKAKKVRVILHNYYDCVIQSMTVLYSKHRDKLHKDKNENEKKPVFSNSLYKTQRT